MEKHNNVKQLCKNLTAELKKHFYLNLYFKIFVYYLFYTVLLL